MACSSSSRRKPHGRFHRVAPNHAGGGRECHRVHIDANEAYRLNQRYESAPRDMKLPEGWHLNPNMVQIPPPPTGRESSLSIVERKQRAGPGFTEDPPLRREGSVWDEMFEAEHEAARHSFFASYEPEWFLRDSVSPPSSDDNEDAARSDKELYQCLPEEMPPPGWWKKGPDGGSGGGCGGGDVPIIVID